MTTTRPQQHLILVRHGEAKQKEEGIKIAVETIQKLKKIDGVSGVHIMAIEWEEAVPEIVQKAKLQPAPKKGK